MAALAVLIAACSQARAPELEQAINDCARCHGYPPANGTHPANATCHLCHAGTVADDDVTILAGGLHENGVVDSTGHAPGYVNTHGGDALAFLGTGAGSCTACHTGFGAGSTGKSCDGCHATAVTASAPDWKQNCTFCHGDRTADVTTAIPAAAPPLAVDKTNPDQTIANPGVGAHQAHLTAGPYAAAFACDTCHELPSDPMAHFTGGAATLTWSTLASTGVTPAYSNGSCTVYCHGSGAAWPAGSVAANPQPQWTSTDLACDACHAARPATGNTIGHDLAAHQTTSGGGPTPCAECHLGYVEGTSVDPDHHVDGARTVAFTNVGGTVTVLTNPGWSTCRPCHETGPTGNAAAGVWWLVP